MLVQQSTRMVPLMSDTPLTSLSSHVTVGRKTHASSIGNIVQHLLYSFSAGIQLKVSLLLMN